jgi:glucose/mannose-6-phosphate isomerase
MSEQRAELDRPETYGVIDRAGMLGHISGMPERLQAVWLQVRFPDLPDKHTDIFSFIVLGIGGAALSGDLLRGLVAHTALIPVIVARGYDLPAFVGPDSIAVAVSHSGNTQETLTLFEEAVDRGVKPVIVTTGGTLEGLATVHRAPRIRYPSDLGVPAALAAEFLALVGIAHEVHVLGSDPDADVTEAIVLLEQARDAFGPGVPTERNPAKTLAHLLEGKAAIIYGAGILESVARCWKGQLNGYAKAAAFADSLPEGNHTTIMGYEAPESVVDRLCVVQLRSSFDSPGVRRHWDALQEWCDAHAIATTVVEGQGQSRLGQMLWTMAFGDWIAYYRALLNGVDPSAEAAIQFVKQRLAATT